MVVVVVAFGPTVLQLVLLALWVQVADRLVIIVPHHTHLLLDKDIPEGKVDTILPILLNILEPAAVAVQASKVVQECIMIQIEDLMALAVKADIMNGIVLMLQTQDGLLDQQHGDTEVTG
jgi:hypothetical protein